MSLKSLNRNDSWDRRGDAVTINKLTTKNLDLHVINLNTVTEQSLTSLKIKLK